MSRKTAALLPSTATLLKELGERLRLSRLRRRLPALRAAKRAGMAPMTLRNVEQGGSGVTIGAYLAVMQVLGIERDLDLLAQSDPVGRTLQDARLPDPNRKARVRKRANQAVAMFDRTGPRRSSENPAVWPDANGFASSKALAELIDTKGSPSRRKRR